MKTLCNPKDKEEILQRLERIQPASQRRWGKMSAPQMVCHLSDSFRGPMGEKTVTSALWFARGFVKWFALYVPLPWPKGVKTRPEMDQQISGTPPGEFEADMRELRRLLDRFTRQPRDFEWHPHPIFGPMSEKDWERWGYLHMDHHLRQFGAQVLQSEVSSEVHLHGEPLLGWQFGTMPMLRSVIAVIAGYLVFTASAVALFKISGRDPHAPADLVFMGLTVLYGMFFAAVGGYIAAWLAGRWEFEHSLAVAGLIAAGGAASLLARPGQGALWTQLAAVLIMAPMAMAGGYLRLRQVGSAKE